MAADVFYGDTRLAAGAVEVTPISGAAEPTVRIRSRQPLNEPFVTLTVKAGCSGGFSRRYTMLADMVSDPMVASAVPAAVASPASSLPPTRSSAVPAEGLQAPVRPSAGVSPPAAKPRASVAKSPTTASRPATRRATVAAPASTPKLKLEPLDVAINRDPTLRLSTEITSAQEGGEETRAQARALWQAINATPEEVLKRSQDLGSLDAEVRKLREAQALAEARQAELVSELRQAQQARYQNPLVYGLGAALLVALSGIWYVRRRPSVENASKAWWAGEEGASPTEGPPSRRKVDDFDESRIVSPPPLEDSPKRPSVGSAKVATAATSGVERLPLPPADRRDFAPSAMGSHRSVATEELFDVQQQADFFVSLGEDEQAIRVLRNHLIESHEPSAMAYLDLFKLYHRLNRRDDYEVLRDEFNRVFNAGAPPFDRYADQGRGLDAYETAFGRIQALWPQPRVLDLIERSIFRDDQDGRTEVFDLEAYRELLMLHAMAKDIIQRGDVPAKPEPGVGFQHTAMQPLRLSPTAQTESQQADAVAKTPPASSNLGLDIDLDDLESPPEFQPSMPVLSPMEESTKPPLQAAHAVEPPASMSNWLDFEVIDFEPPNTNPAGTGATTGSAGSKT